MSNQPELEGDKNIAPRGQPSALLELEAAPAPEPSNRSRRMFDILYRYRWMGLGLIALFTGLGAGLTWVIHPYYVSTGSIIIGRPSQRWARIEPVTRWYSSDTDRLIQTNILELTSRAVARRVIAKLDLEQKQPAIRKTLAAQGKNLSAGQRDQIAVDLFRTRLKASPDRMSRTVEVSYGAHDPRLAAQVVNTTIQEFIAYALEARYLAGAQASRWLRQQLRGVRQQVAAAQNAVVNFQLRHAYTPLVVPGGQQNVLLQQLDNADRQLTAARAERITREAILRTYGGGLGTLPARLRPAALDAAETAVAADQAALNKAEAVYQPGFAVVRQARARLRRARAQLAALRGQTTRGLQARVDAARRSETALGALVAQLQHQAAGESATEMQYQILNDRAKSGALLYHDLMAKLREAGLLSSLPTSNIRPLDQAQPPLAPQYPKLPIDTGLGLALGLLAAGMGIGMRARWEDRILQSEDVHAGHPQLLPLGIIPVLNRQCSAAREEGPGLNPTARALPGQVALSDHYARLAANLTMRRRPPAALLFTSAGPGEGKTTTVCQLGMTLARQGWKTLLVDGDVRRPGCHRYFEVENPRGLLAAQAGEAIEPLPLAAQLDLLACETRNAGEAQLQPRRLPELLRQWRAEYDFVLLDSPPGNLTADALLLSQVVDGVVLVLRWGSTTMSEARLLGLELQRARAPLLGTVLNAADLSAPEFRYYRRHQHYYLRPGDAGHAA